MNDGSTLDIIQINDGGAVSSNNVVNIIGGSLNVADYSTVASFVGIGWINDVTSTTNLVTLANVSLTLAATNQTPSHVFTNWFFLNGSGGVNLKILGHPYPEYYNQVNPGPVVYQGDESASPTVGQIFSSDALGNRLWTNSVKGIGSFINNKASLMSSNLPTSATWLFTNTDVVNWVCYLTGGTVTGISQNTSPVAVSTTGITNSSLTLILQPGESLGVTNGATAPHFAFKRF